MSGIGNDYFSINPVSSNWYDRDRESPYTELAGRFSLYLLGIASLVGVVVAVYYCCTTTETITRWDGTVFQDSNAPFSAFPLVFGTPIPVGLLIGAGMMERKRYEEKHRYNNPAQRDSLYLKIKDADLDGLVIMFDNQNEWLNSGVGPYVRHGLLSVEDGNRLVDMISDYKSNMAMMKEYAKELGCQDVEKRIEEVRTTASTFGQNYLDAKKKIEELKAEWQELKKSFKPAQTAKEVILD